GTISSRLSVQDARGHIPLAPAGDDCSYISFAAISYYSNRHTRRGNERNFFQTHPRERERLIRQRGDYGEQNARRHVLGSAWDSMDDDQLMICIQSGDSRAFDELVERYQGQLIGFFYRNTRDMQFSEDLTQETLLRVFNQSWDYLPVGKFRAWMYRIARNLLI